MAFEATHKDLILEMADELLLQSENRPRRGII